MFSVVQLTQHAADQPERYGGGGGGFLCAAKPNDSVLEKLARNQAIVNGNAKAEQIATAIASRDILDVREGKVEFVSGSNSYSAPID